MLGYVTTRNVLCLLGCEVENIMFGYLLSVTMLVMWEVHIRTAHSSNAAAPTTVLQVTPQDKETTPTVPTWTMYPLKATHLAHPPGCWSCQSCASLCSLCVLSEVLWFNTLTADHDYCRFSIRFIRRLNHS